MRYIKKIISSLTAYIFIVIIVSIPNKTFCQLIQKKSAANANSLSYKLRFNTDYNLKKNNSSTYLDFKYALDESKPGAPVLPSKIIYFALPPESKITVRLSDPEYKIFSGVKIAVNPSVKTVNDSVLKYIPRNLGKVYFRSDQYPSESFKILGYTWIRNYYCAVVKINTGFYNWKTKQTKLLLSADLHFTITANNAYTVNNSPVGRYDKILRNVIMNYDQAKSFRSFRKFYGYVDSTGNWIDYNSQYVKLKIPSDGIYRIRYQDLISYGITISNVNPASVKIYCKGKELPLYLKISSPGSFSPGDYIEFWAKKNYGSPNYRHIVPYGNDYLNYMNRYSDTTVVWLTWNNVGGRNTRIIDTYQNSVRDTLNSYLDVHHYEKDVRLWYYDSAVPRVQLPFWQENKVWTWAFWGTGGSFTLPFSVSKVIPGSRIHAFVRLISNGADIQINAHKVGMGLNSNDAADTISFNYRQTVNFSSYFPSSLLKEGSNNLKLFGLPTSGSFQQVLLDWIDIEYYRELSAVNDSLYFKFPDSLSKKYRVIRITNINPDSGYVLYKVSPDTVKFENYTVSGGAGRSISFADTVSGGDEYILLSQNYIKSPVFTEKKKFLDLRKPGFGADDIIISNRLLSQSVTQYEDFIKNNYSVRTALVYVNDIYDEFSYGYPEPEAIRNFILYAYNNWTAPSPTYLTLIGDANYDYKNLWSPVPKVRKLDLVPSYGDPVSDNWYCTWDSSQPDIPQMLVGRIPAANNAQVKFYLDKYRKYLMRPYDEWNKKFLFFSGGDPTLPSQLVLLKTVNDSVLNSLVKPKPVGGKGINFYKTINPTSNFGPYSNIQVRNSIDGGGLFISYLGHSGTQTWDNGITSVNDLKNSYSDRFPLITDFGCSTGKFAEPDVNAFGELFLSESDQGQAICYLGNSSWGYISTSTSIPLYFYNYLLKDTVTNIAEAHLLSVIRRFQENGYSDVNRVFAYCNIFFGDPLLNLKLPRKTNLSVSPEDIHFLNLNPTSDEDYLPVKIYYHNFGLVPDDSITVSVKDKVNNIQTFYKVSKVPVPLLTDSLSVDIPIKNIPGNHVVSVILDSVNHLDEIYKNDNSASAEINVYSISFKNPADDKYNNNNTGNLYLLNPVYNPGGTELGYIFQLDTSESFTEPVELKGNMGIFSTKIGLTDLLPKQRYWWRIKTANSNLWSRLSAFTYKASNYNWYVDEPLDSTNNISLENSYYDMQNKEWTLAATKSELKIISGGANDGDLASVQYDFHEVLPSTYFWGIVTATIDTINFKPIKIKYFLYANSPAGDSLLSYLKSLPEGTVMAMSICDDGAQSVLGYNAGTPVRNELKNWGSKYIDSVRYRESWCMLGKKGAAPGTVPEVYKKQFQGIASIDTSKTTKNKSGSVMMPAVSGAAEWDSVKINAGTPGGTSLTVLPVGIKHDGRIDTLAPLNLINGFSSLKNINARLYPKLRFLINLNTNKENVSPAVKSMSIKYNPLPELGLNYQVVTLSSDTLTVGETENLKFYVYNAGGSPADSFNVKVNLVNAGNTGTQIFNEEVDSLNPGGRRLFSINYNTSSGTGIRAFAISIDPGNKIHELFKDNNFYTIPFYIKNDTAKPSVDITFDGKEIINGQYVSSNPDIKISLNDPSKLPVTDTSDVMIFLNNNPVFYSGNSNLNYNFNGSNPKFVINYRPKLQDGNYNLQVIAKNALGTYADSANLDNYFTVTKETHLLYVYNYPNPFKYDTYFTFKLTQIPDEIKIMIYTIAGRLIKKIVRTSGELNFDFNRIHWDGRDEDGDILANGVYLYKVFMKKGGRSESTIQKLVIMR